MDEPSAVLESKDGKVTINPIHAGSTVIGTKGEKALSGMSTPSKQTRDGDQTPQSARTDMNGMDELIQRLAQSNRPEASRNPESLAKRVFMHRREVQEKMLLKYYHYENPHVVNDESHHGTDDPLKALAQRQRARSNIDRSKSIAAEARSIMGLRMLNPSGMPMICWSILILIIDGIYTALWVPVEAAFDLPHDIGTITGTLDFCVGMLLCVDIFLRFHTPIELTSSYMKYMLKQGPAVAHMYVCHGTFVLDLLASVPLVVLPFVGAEKSAIVIVLALRILRLVRVLKIINMLFYIQMISVSGASGWRMLVGNIISTMYTICVMINFCACLWYYVGTIGEEGVEGWLAQEYKFQGPPDEAKCEAYKERLINEGKDDLVDRVVCEALWFDKGEVGLWLISIYFVVVTLTTVGYGDITPSGIVEVVTAMIIMIVGLGVFASILGKVADIVANSSRSARQEQEVRKKLTDVQQWMADLTLTSNTRSSVLRFYAEDWNFDGDEHAQVLTELPDDVAATCIWDLVHFDLKQVPLFQHLAPPATNFDDEALDIDDYAKAIASYMRPQNATRGTHLTRQGGPVEHIYFLQRGQVEVTNLGETVGMLQGPTVFGEAALLKDVSDTARVRLSGYRTYTSCMIWNISLEDISHLSVIMPQVHQGLLRGLKHGVFRKLLLLDLSRLKLIKMFLYCMKSEEGEQARRGLERMQHQMHGAVDMALVIILAYYDREFRKAARTGQQLTASMASPQVGGFLPHVLHEEKEEKSLPLPGNTLPPSSHRSGAMSAVGGQPMTSTNVMWGPSMESTMNSAMSTIDKKSVHSDVDADAAPTAAEMSEVLDKFNEACADVEKKKEAEKQARVQKELARTSASGDLEEQGTPRSFGLTAGIQSMKRQDSKTMSPGKKAGTVGTAEVAVEIPEGKKLGRSLTRGRSKKATREAVDNGGPSAAGALALVDAPRPLAVNPGRKNPKELSFAGSFINQAGVQTATQPDLAAHSEGNGGATPTAEQNGPGMAAAPIGKNFSFPRVVAAQSAENITTLETNHELMSNMMKGQHDSSDRLGPGLKTGGDDFDDQLQAMSGSQMVQRAIEDITDYAGDL